ncbi:MULTISPECIES: Crp/Fnr family transcriptional regulator [unclassified Rhizobium]|jgi:CRP-like cAMP-binding protein|uniref:Crp/Fnr family transcriptional regulator n=1 Tax=unclassified Rhizobium TaxID=2613769 RepID=UPI000372CA63|nr:MULTISPECIES: Crp/Fnr family transcriptional regulator [unclassified Rhizobium]MBD9448200.1 Crp/Fnr family transcriptional regulator [Rhizobium sp. RHZ01]MBD9454792.1 Crp/Fnr family transcriptional regulator [Rhizobium sp. RHZ02]NMN73067.1 CRP-like cAMP-binding protein [Rhizobium sp. 57MFTsu3.2]
MSGAFKLSSAQQAMLGGALITSNLDRHERDALLSCAVAVRYGPQDVLFREHEKAHYFYCVLSGYVRLYRGSEEREADVSICEPGDSFGECLVLAGDAYNYSAQAMEHVILARFDLAEVKALLAQHPRIGSAIARSLSRHLLSTMECLARDRMQTSQQRVAHYLLTHCTSEGARASLRLPFQKRLLARKLGLAPEALSRAFSALRTSGVRVSGRAIAIEDVNALRQV